MISKLAKSFMPAHPNNYYGTRTKLIDKVILHHMGGVSSAEQCAISFQNPKRGAASNYCIGNDGTIVACVDEFFASGASSNKEADMSAITIEVSNSSNTSTAWPISDKAFNALINLLADISQRYEIDYVPRKTLCWHNLYAATICPGPFILDKIPTIISRVKEIAAPKDASKGEIKAFNAQRTANSIVIYNEGKSTNTNAYGGEVVCDRNGVILDIQYYKGDAKIPVGGFVCSGHGTGAKFLEQCKIGYRLTIADDKVVITKKQCHSLNGLDIGRYTNYLVFYTKGTTANTNPYGYEVRIKNYKADNDPVYGKGHMELHDGWILSGHGEAGEWIKKNIKKGTKVSRSGNVVIVG